MSIRSSRCTSRGWSRPRARPSSTCCTRRRRCPSINSVCAGPRARSCSGTTVRPSTMPPTTTTPSAAAWSAPRWSATSRCEQSTTTVGWAKARLTRWALPRMRHSAVPTTHVRVAAIHHGGHGAASCKGWGRARLTAPLPTLQLLTLAPDRFLRLAEDLGWERGEPLEQVVDLLGRSRVDVEAGLVGLGHEFRIFHGGGQRVAQRLDAVCGDSGRAGERAAEQELAEMDVEHRAVHLGLGIVEHARHRTELVRLLVAHLDHDLEAAALHVIGE